MKIMTPLGIALLMSFSNIQAQNTELVFFPVTESPAPHTEARFPGLDTYIKANLEYPTAALESRTEGRVEAVALIEADGSVSDVQITRSVSPSCNQAVVRVLKSMPAWVPATENGQPVAQKVDIAIRFELKS